jgi:hypothetical protein
MTYAIELDAVATSSPVLVGSGRAASNSPRPEAMPTMIPRDELFFWTRAWQEGERESAKERARGNVLTFDDPKDLLRWLLDPED